MAAGAGIRPTILRVQLQSISASPACFSGTAQEGLLAPGRPWGPGAGEGHIIYAHHLQSLGHLCGTRHRPGLGASRQVRGTQGVLSPSDLLSSVRGSRQAAGAHPSVIPGRTCLRCWGRCSVRAGEGEGTPVGGKRREPPNPSMLPPMAALLLFPGLR